MVNLTNEMSIFEKSQQGAGAYSSKPFYELEGVHETMLPPEYMRQSSLELPDISERDIVKHFSNLASRTFSLDEHFYPLGSCTMKYNPKVNEDIAGLEGFLNLHPLQPALDVQGALKMLYQFEKELSFICGMDKFSLQPSAGAHGEVTALLIAKKYFSKRDEKRTKIVVPDSSHGTNPASASLAGFDLVTIPSKDGVVDLELLKRECDSSLAVLMLTNPNTLGLFEEDVIKICDMVHQCGGLTYQDGANMNALLGLARPGDMGFDMMHVNLHKTFSTPHGGGGPGSGPVGVKHHLESFLPVPFVEKSEDDFYTFNYGLKDSIGAVKSFWGNFGVILRASVYLDAIGLKGLRETSKAAIINANYLKKKLSQTYLIPYEKPCMHEFVMVPDNKKVSTKTLDIAKRLLDFGIHSPTVYFPLIVKEAIMIEPTETESKQVLDEFVTVMKEIAEEAVSNPEKLKEAPFDTFRKRIDEVTAARKPVLKWE